MPAELFEKIRLAGIVDNARDELPLTAKLASWSAGRIDTLVLNTLATEPYCSADARLLAEHGERVFTGLAILHYITKAAACLVVVDEKRTVPAAAVATMFADARFKEFSLLKIRKPRYPLHEERLLVRACTGIELSSGVPASKAGCAVIGVAAAAAVAEAIVDLVPSCRCVVTVDGPLAGRPGNLLAPIGTPARFLLEACDVDLDRVQRLVFGGALSGFAVRDLDRPITKGVNSILPLAALADRKEQQCIGCRRCRGVCRYGSIPAGLQSLFGQALVANCAHGTSPNALNAGVAAMSAPQRSTWSSISSWASRRLREGGRPHERI